MKLIPYVVAAAGFLAGAWLVGLWLFGLAVMAESVVLAFVWDDGKPPARLQPRGGRTLREVLDEADRAA